MKNFVKVNIMTILKEQYDESITSGQVIDIINGNKDGKDEIIKILKNNFTQNFTDEKLTEALSGYINGKEMVRLVAKSSTLTVDQVREAFLTFREVVDNITSSNNMIDMGFAIPFFGKVEVKHKKGRKAGTNIVRPTGIGEKNEVEILSDDCPDYNRLFVNISPTIQNQLKEKSIERNNRMKR